MKYLNLHRELIGKLAVDQLAKKKGLKITLPHVRVLFLLHAVGRQHGWLAQTTLWSLLIRLHRASAYGYLTELLRQLQAHGLVNVKVTGKRRTFSISAEGRLLLAQFEKAIRICRVDRRVLILNPNKTKNAKRKK